MDVVAVVVVHDEKLCVARAGGKHKTSGLVCEDFTSVFRDGEEAMVGPCTVKVGGQEGVFIGLEGVNVLRVGRINGWRGFVSVACRLRVLATLIEVPFDCRGGDGRELAKGLWGETGEVGHVVL